MRVVRCFAFLDLCGFTAYTEARGDGEAVAVLAALRATLRAAAERHGVRVTKWLGDGAMLSGIDPSAVVACVVEVHQEFAQHSPLPLRGGISEGPVIMFEGDDYIGAAVNFAARLCDVACADQLLIESDTATRVPPYLEVRPVPGVALDGFDGVAEVLEVVRPQVAAARRAD
jgi:class 3 adenylate cyclase